MCVCVFPVLGEVGPSVFFYGRPNVSTHFSFILHCLFGLSISVHSLCVLWPVLLMGNTKLGLMSLCFVHETFWALKRADWKDYKPLSLHYN